MEKKIFYEILLRYMEHLIWSAQASKRSLEIIRNYPDSIKYFSIQDGLDIKNLEAHLQELIADLEELHKNALIEDDLEELSQKINKLSPEVAKAYGFVCGKQSSLGKEKEKQSTKGVGHGRD